MAKVLIDDKWYEWNDVSDNTQEKYQGVREIREAMRELEKHPAVAAHLALERLLVKILEAK